MNTNIIEAREFIAKAREALKGGDKETARDLGEKAALLAPDLEDAWLVLTAADSNPEDALAYAQKALELNPASLRARKGVEWAMGKLKQAQASPELSQGNVSGSSTASVYDEAPATPAVNRQAKKSPPPTEKKPGNQRNLLFIGLGVGLVICIILGIVAWMFLSKSGFAAFAPSNNNNAAQGIHWARVDVPKATVTPIDVSAFAPQPTSAAGLPQQSTLADAASTSVSADVPTAIATDAPTVTSEATETPGVMAMDVLADTPTSAYVPPTNAPNAQPPAVVASGNHGSARWIDVNLSTQSVYAYEGDTVVNSFIVSTGTALHPTVTGQYKIYVKFVAANMSGPGYFLPNVPYVMYFYKGYGLHGTYWHHNFGTPMSHGCVNLETSNAQWLFNWASVGTLVNVHY
jgi:lipoprotein-anchoring transpeptidase ErfK/SrfK